MVNNLLIKTPAVPALGALKTIETPHRHVCLRLHSRGSPAEILINNKVVCAGSTSLPVERVISVPTGTAGYNFL
jgi:hypothetical protein